MKPQFSVTVGNRKYPYFMRKGKDGETHFFCPAANIRQGFASEDIPGLLIDLPHIIISEKEYRKNKEQKEVIRFRVNAEDKKKIEQKAVKKGFPSVSDFLRTLALKA